MPNTIEASHRVRVLRVTLIVALIVVAAWLALVLIQPTLGGLPACATESSTNCYWDAAHHGNGVGTSFINYEGQYYYQEVTR